MEINSELKLQFILPNPGLSSWNELPRLDLYMDQLLSILDEELQGFIQFETENAITTSMINNYVKQKLIPPPLKKRYTREHVSALLMVALLKSVLSIPELTLLFAGLKKEYHDSWADVHELFLSIVYGRCSENNFSDSPKPCYGKALFLALGAYLLQRKSQAIISQNSAAMPAKQSNK